MSQPFWNGHIYGVSIAGDQSMDSSLKWQPNVNGYLVRIINPEDYR